MSESPPAGPITDHLYETTWTTDPPVGSPFDEGQKMPDFGRCLKCGGSVWDHAQMSIREAMETVEKVARAGQGKSRRPIKPIPQVAVPPRRHFPMVEVPAPSRLRLWLRRQAQRIAWRKAS